MSSFPPWFPGLFRNKTLFKSLQVFTMAQRSNAEVWVCVAPISLSLHACPYVSVSVILRAVNHHRGNTGASSLRSMRIWFVSGTEQKLRKKKQKIRCSQLFYLIVASLYLAIASKKLVIARFHLTLFSHNCKMKFAITFFIWTVILTVESLYLTIASLHLTLLIFPPRIMR